MCLSMVKALCFLLLLLVVGTPVVWAVEQGDYPDLADRRTEDVVLGQIYRIGETGICGSMQSDHILVTHVMPKSVADGKVLPGDKLIAMQYRGVGGSPESIRRTVQKRYYRLGRDWDWHLYLTLERPGLLNGKGNQLTFDLRLPRMSEEPYHFGPTGFFATIHKDYIQVTHVDKGSPSDGKLAVGDRIFAVNDQHIPVDIFTYFARHIDTAETAKGGGNLALLVRRITQDAGSEEQNALETDTKTPVLYAVPDVVTLQLEVLGDYSDTMPVGCSKTDKIITQTADGIIARGKYGRINTSLICLLSTGEDKYIAHVGNVIRQAEWGKPDITLPITGSKVSWHRAYTLITLAEYYLLTRDAYVLPAIKAYTGVVARGQDAAGLWNHQAANPEVNNGNLHGRLYGYGAINQTSVALWIGLILARECGVQDAEVDMAIEKTHRLYSYWVDRGRLPYGNHGAEEEFFNNNGTSGSAAVGFALLNDQAGARFFSKMSAAASDEILTGHTGPWFNQFWSGLGANVAGPEVLKAHMRALHWLRTVTRTWEHRFLHMEARKCKPNDYGLGTSGATLLNLSAGRRALRITGRGMDQSLWLDDREAQNVVDAGMIDYASKTSMELLDLLGHELPPVRVRAAEMLAIQDTDVTGHVMNMLAMGNRNQRMGAIHAISKLQIETAQDALIEIVRNTGDDLWIRQLALRAVADFDGTEKYAPILLEMLVAEKDYDVQGRFDQDVGQALVDITDGNPYALGLDKAMLYQGVNKLLGHSRQEGRGAGMKLLQHIPVEDLGYVVDAMIEVIEDKDRQRYVSYHGDNHRQLGLNILYGLNVRESLDLTLRTIHEKVGRGWRARNRKAFMKTWGTEAQPLIPRIREVLGKEADEFVEIITQAQAGRDMKSLDVLLQKHSDNHDAVK